MRVAGSTYFKTLSAGTTWMSTARNPPDPIPGADNFVYVTGCANVRDVPGLSRKILACLANRTRVVVDSAPIYADGKIWWHLQGRGWMAHDFLVAP